MRKRLRQIEERARIMHQKRSKIRKITIKFDGRRSFLTREEPATRFPDEASVSEIGDDHMEIDDHRSERTNVHALNNNSTAGRNNEDDDSENPNSIQHFIASIGGSDVVLVMEKKLTKSDCDKNQGRLLMPILKVNNTGFLSMNEKKKLTGVIRESISVEVFDPKRRKLTLNLAQWKMKNENLVFKTNWVKLVHTNGFKENMVIRVLAFRVDQRLCFAVVRVV
ncbi:hypothetical protein R6Q59_031209 [Mikania micrantha]